MKNFFKNLLHGKYPFRGRSSRNMKCVYAGPQDPRMSEGGMKLVYAGPPVKDAEAPKPLEETGTEEQDTPVVNV